MNRSSSFRENDKNVRKLCKKCLTASDFREFPISNPTQPNLIRSQAGHREASESGLVSLPGFFFLFRQVQVYRNTSFFDWPIFHVASKHIYFRNSESVPKLQFSISGESVDLLESDQVEWE